MDFPIRINKYLSQQKIASRREADAMIGRGEVLINGILATVGQSVTADDEVTVAPSDTSKQLQYLLYYKGRGVLSHGATETDTDIVSKIAKDYDIVDVYPVGRLDKASEGLILLTNDGRVTGPLLDPKATHEKEYEVIVDKPTNAKFKRTMEQGVTIEGYKTKPTVFKSTNNPKRFFLTLTEGKKHQIRRMCAALGYQVQSLKRVRIMHLEIGKLKPNQYRKLTKDEVSTLLKTLEIN